MIAGSTLGALFDGGAQQPLAPPFDLGRQLEKLRHQALRFQVRIGQNRGPGHEGQRFQGFPGAGYLPLEIHQHRQLRTLTGDRGQIRAHRAQQLIELPLLCGRRHGIPPLRIRPQFRLEL